MMSNGYSTVRGIQGALQTRYPSFLFGLPLSCYEIPVFIYHDIEPSRFAEDLAFLRDNGYRTVCLEEFVSSTLRKEPAKKRVLLTFDDARKTFYTEGLSLLRQFNSRATLFVPTHWMEQRADLFMTWNEIRSALQTGYVDVQSHAHRHALVAVTHRLLGFATPAALAHYDVYDWPMRRESGSDRLGAPPLGYPIYAAKPLLSATTRYLENEAVVSACMTLVQREGGAAFFQRSDALRQLRRLHRQQPDRRDHMDETALRRLMQSEFELSRAAFERHLGLAPTCFAYPWVLGTKQSLQLARRFGIRSAFGAAQNYGLSHDGRLPVPVFGRLRADWLRLLPGKGRAHVVSIVRGKLMGFAKAQHLAH